MDIPLNVAIEEAKKLILMQYESFILEFLAEILGGKMQRNEIDGIITQKKKTLAIVKVKIGKVSPKDIEVFIEKAEKLGVKARKIVVSANKLDHADIISLDINDLIKIAKNPEMVWEFELL